MKKITLLLTSLALSLIGYSQSFTAQYTFDSVKTTTGTIDPSFVPTVTGITFGSFSATGTPANPNATARFSFTDWSLGSVNGDSLYSQMTGFVDTTEHYDVTITPQASYSITLSSITFRLGRSGTGIRNYSVRSSADGFTTNLPASISPANLNLEVETGDIFFLKPDINTTNQNGSTITLSGASFTNFSGPITFRFYAWNAEGVGGTFSIDNVTFTGSMLFTGIKNNLINTGINLYPNPSNTGVFNVNLENSSKAILTVYDMIGNQIMSKEVHSGNQTIDLSDHSNGNYFVRIISDKETITKKIIVNK
jgi:hypothetical protein